MDPWHLLLPHFLSPWGHPCPATYEWTEASFIPHLPGASKGTTKIAATKIQPPAKRPRTRPILTGMRKVGELSKIFMYGSRPKENSHAITNCGQRIIYQQTNAGTPECLSSNEIIYLWKPMPVLGLRPIYQAWEACGYAPGPLTFHLFPLVLQDETLPLILLPSPVHLPTECKCKAEGLRNNSKAMDQGHGYKSLPLALWLMQAVCHTWARWPLWHNREKYCPRSKDEIQSTLTNSGVHRCARCQPRASSLPNTACSRATLLLIAAIAFSLVSSEIFPLIWTSKFVSSSWSVSFSKKVIKLTRRYSKMSFSR